MLGSAAYFLEDWLPAFAPQASCEESVRRALADVRRKAAAIHQGDGPMADEDALEVGVPIVCAGIFVVC